MKKEKKKKRRRMDEGKNEIKRGEDSNLAVTTDGAWEEGRSRESL